LRVEQKETMGLNNGALRRGVEDTPRDERPTLAKLGIDKNLAHQAFAEPPSLPSLLPSLLPSAPSALALAPDDAASKVTDARPTPAEGRTESNAPSMSTAACGMEKLLWPSWVPVWE
jgi:hypothetical protein